MEARFWRVVPRFAAVAAMPCIMALLAIPARAGAYRTANFTVAAPTAQLAKEIGDAAESWRRELAIEWLGSELPRWSKPCPIKARVAPELGAGGETSFVFDRGEVFGWRMNIQGSRERLLDSVVPHEVMHTIFASHFRQPLPRWADEGACTTVEHQSEIAKQERLLIRFLKTNKGIPFSAMFAMKEYPAEVLPLYAQGHSLAKFLLDQKGKRVFLDFLTDGMGDGNWPQAVDRHYGYPHLLALQNSWMDWIRSGRPPIQGEDALLAANPEPTPSVANPQDSLDAAPADALVVRGQDPKARLAVAADPSQSATPSVYAASVAQNPVTPTREESSVLVGDRPSRRTWPASPAAGPLRSPPTGASVYDASRGGTLRR